MCADDVLSRMKFSIEHRYYDTLPKMPKGIVLSYCRTSATEGNVVAVGSHVMRGVSYHHRDQEALIELHLVLLLAEILHRLLDFVLD